MAKFEDLTKDLRKFKRPEKEKLFIRYFKAGKGGYAEGDRFLGLKMDETRSIAKKYKDLEYKDLGKLLASKIHEERMTAVMILVNRTKKGNLSIKKEVYDFFINNLSGINNWDLVDVSAPYIIGSYIFLSKANKDILYTFAKSDNL